MATPVTSSHLLVVDDEPAIRAVVRAALESDGYLVTEAVNGADALRTMESLEFDALILDFNMPVADGASVMEQLSGRRDHPPVIVMTAYGSVALAARMMRLGAADFLEKPLTPGELLAAVANVLSADEAEAELEVKVTIPGVDAFTPARVLAAVRQALAGGRVDVAETTLRALADAVPSAALKPPYLNLKGVVQELRGRLIAARAVYRMAISADPTHAYLPPVENAWRLYDAITGHPRPDAVVSLGEPAELTAAFAGTNLSPESITKRLKRRRPGRTFALTPPSVPRPARGFTGVSE